MVDAADVRASFSRETVAVRRLDRKTASQFLKEHGFEIAPATLAKYVTIGGGPPFVSFGRKPLYDPAVLLAWAEGRCSGPHRSSSDRAAPAQSAA